MKKHTIYRYHTLPENFGKLARAVFAYFEGSHDLLEVDGKLVFTDASEEEINSEERDFDSTIDDYEWNEFDSLRDFEIFCLKCFSERLQCAIASESKDRFYTEELDAMLKHL